MHPAKTYHSWTLNITSTTKRSYVDSIANVWKKDSIKLDVSKMEIGSGGILSKIKGTVSITSMGNVANEKFDYTDVTYCKIKIDNSPHIKIEGK
jgi:hypothetical protein